MIGQKMLTILALAQVALGVSKCKFTTIPVNSDNKNKQTYRFFFGILCLCTFEVPGSQIQVDYWHWSPIWVHYWP